VEVRVPVASPVLSPFLSVITNVAQPVDWLYYFFVLLQETRLDAETT
jgi:hypothetical protein